MKRCAAKLACSFCKRAEIGSISDRFPGELMATNELLEHGLLNCQYRSWREVVCVGRVSDRVLHIFSVFTQ